MIYVHKFMFDFGLFVNISPYMYNVNSFNRWKMLDSQYVCVFVIGFGGTLYSNYSKLKPKRSTLTTTDWTVRWYILLRGDCEYFTCLSKQYMKIGLCSSCIQ